jgi:hypothetical protein
MIVGGAIIPCDVEASYIDMHQGNALVPMASIVVPSASTIVHCWVVVVRLVVSAGAAKTAVGSIVKTAMAPTAPMGRRT